MSRYLKNRWFQVGLALAIFGCGPLLAIIAIDAIGLWPDPNPNPVGPGILFFLTSWPAVICLAIGIARVRTGYVAPSGTADGRKWWEHPAVRVVAGFFGAVMLFRGLFDIFVLGWVNRGSVSAVIVGVVGLWWGVKGKVPGWFRR